MKTTGLVCIIFLLLQLLSFSNSQCPWAAPGVKLWSNSASWPNGKLPGAGESVIIPAGVSIVYDLSSPLLFNGITVLSGAKLIFDGTKNVAMNTKYVNILIGGSFLIGSSSCPYTMKAEITLFGSYDNITSIQGMGTKGILNAGTLEFYGVPPSPSWTQISSTVNVNAVSFSVKDSVTNWNVGDSIVLASTDYYQELSENFKIVSISGKTITVDRPVKYLHWGDNGEYAEVGSLTRNIVVKGDESSEDIGFGGHVLSYGNSTTARFYGVEFTRMGQRGVIGRYPVHFHLMENQIGKGMFANESSFHHNYQRCLTIHGSHGISVQNNVGFNVSGHCYFLEEGSETKNYFNHNLGMVVTRGYAIPTDIHPSVFWITNPDNIFVNNVAVGGKFGFWFSLPIHPIGGTSHQTWIFPRFSQLGGFDNNIAHSAFTNGIHIDDCLDADGREETCSYTPLVPPYTDATRPYNTAPVRSIFRGNVAYKNREYGIWMRGSYFTVVNSTLMDNGIGINLPITANLLLNSVIVGETPNIGTPGLTMYFDDLGRSRPRLYHADFPVQGFQCYDNTGSQFARNVIFVDFTSNSVRNAGAVSIIGDGIFVLPPNDALAEITLINSNVFIMEENSNNRDGPNHIAIQDADGSLTGSYGSFIVSNNSILSNEGNCQRKPEWGSVVHCPKNENGYSYLSIVNADTANTNFGDSLSMHYRATFIPFGQPNMRDFVTGGDVNEPVRTLYATNVISRKGYVVQFPHPTPPSLQVTVRYAATGEWAVVALSYPSTTSFTITRGFSKTLLTRVTTLSALSSTSYFYDNTQQYLYLMYFEDNGRLENTTGFPQYGYGDSYIDILASCGRACSVSAVQSIPPAFSPNEDLYKAKLQNCAGGGSSPVYEGKAIFNYNPTTKRITYLIYHNIPDATYAKVTGSRGEVYTFPVAQSPIRGGFEISWTKHNDLWNGNWSVTIESSYHAIKGNVGCVGTCSSPPLISAMDPCARVENEAVIYRDSLAASLGWTDWSWSTNRTFDSSADKKCGTSALSVRYFSWGNLALHVGVGNCLPGACTLSWQLPFLSVFPYKYFQFLVKSLAGPAKIPLTIRTNDFLGVQVGADLLVSSKYIDNNVIEDSWTRVKVPLADLGFKGTELVGTFSIITVGEIENYLTFLFDEIRLVPAYTDPITKGPQGSVKLYSESC